MKKDSLTDYLSYIAFRLLGPFIRLLPIRASLSLGKILGDMLYYLDFKHKAVAYANIKKALGDTLSIQQLRRITKESYKGLGQNFIELFCIPFMDEEYIKKYVNIEGRQYPHEALKKGKGVILLSIHSGSWELSNLVCAELGLNFSLLVREQKYSRLNGLLNTYRIQKGFKLIQRQNQLRGLIYALKNNEAVGMSADQGGKSGVLVKFFGREASMASGAVNLALRYGAVIVPAFYTRVDGPYFKTILMPPLELKRTGNDEQDVRDNLQMIASLFEKYIRQYPKDYLWSYKIWKYGRQRNVLILSDGKTGHLRQSQAVADALSGYAGEIGIRVRVDTTEVRFRGGLSRIALAVSNALSGRYSCQGCLWCLRKCLGYEAYNSLQGRTPDIIISCGSSLAPVNFLLSRENSARSIVIMRPGTMSMRRFDLVIMPYHDKPPKRKNCAVTDGALNLINERYLKEQSAELIKACGLGPQPPQGYIGLLIGGDTKDFHLDPGTLLKVIRQVKTTAEKLDLHILVTTSRRTAAEAEKLIKEELGAYPRCKLLVIANEKNLSSAVGGILALSRLVIVSPESISMISEAASANRYIVVFNARLDRRHACFLDHLARKNYIHLTPPDNLGAFMENLLKTQPPINVLNDRARLAEALKRIF